MDPVFDILVLVRWVHFGAMALLFGGTLFWAYTPLEPGLEPSQSRRFGRRSLKFAALVALASGAGWLAATIANMSGLDGLGDPETLHAFFLETTFGPIEAVRMALLAVVTILAFAPMRDRWRLVGVAAVSAALLVSQAWLGHAAEGGPHGTAMVVAYTAHVLAAAAWLGGLPFLLVRILELRRRSATPAAILRVLSRFSLMATGAVALVLASGVANAAFRGRGRIGWVLATPYGEVLLVKVALVGLMLGFAAHARFVLMPRLHRPDPPDAVAWHTATAIGSEIALGALVLMAAAALGITPPPSH